MLFLLGIHPTNAELVLPATFSQQALGQASRKSSRYLYFLRAWHDLFLFVLPSAVKCFTRVCQSFLIFKKQHFIINGLNYSAHGLTFPCMLTSFEVLCCCSGFFLLVSTVGISAPLTFISEQLSRRKCSPQRYNIREASPPAAAQLCRMLNMESTDILTHGKDLRLGKSFIIRLSCHLNGVKNNF